MLSRAVGFYVACSCLGGAAATPDSLVPRLCTHLPQDPKVIAIKANVAAAPVLASVSSSVAAAVSAPEAPEPPASEPAAAEAPAAGAAV